jgi:broad specificity phosphatase PhoE
MVNDAGRPATIVLVRHTQTEWCLLGRHTGRTDIPALESGYPRAIQAGQVVRALVPQASLVLTSPLSRSMTTCRLAGFAEFARTSDDLLEWDYGDYEGHTTAQIQGRRPGWDIFRDGCPNGEDVADVAARVTSVIDICLEQPGDSVLFAHSHVLRVLAAVWLQQDPRQARCYVLSPGGVSSLGFEHGNRVINTWNRV